METLLKPFNCEVIRVPKCQTHIFQPCDQFVITSVKKAAKRAHEEFVAELFAAKDADAASLELVQHSLPVLRARKVRFLRQAMESTSPECVLKSWAVTGILREAYGMETSEVVLYDMYKQAVTDGQPFMEAEDATLDDAEDDKDDDVCRGFVASTVLQDGQQRKPHEHSDVKERPS